MAEFIYAMMKYPFMQRAVLVGIPVSLCCALLGVNLVLKKYSMIGDGLSHVGFGALAVALVLNAAPLLIALPVVTFTAFMLLRQNKNSFLNGETGIAVISTASMAFGIMMISVRGGMNTDIYNYMFGSILAADSKDVILSVSLSVIVLVVYFVLYNRFFSITFDEVFAEATGQRSAVYNSILAVLTSVTVVVGMRLMGTLLISSLIIFPVLSAMEMCRSFRNVTIAAAGISVLCFIIGFIISFVYSAPTGASVVLCNCIVLILLYIIRKIRDK